MSRFSQTRRLLLLGAMPAACGLASPPGRTVPTVGGLRAFRDEADGAVVTVSQPDVGGRFIWNARSTAVDDGGLVIAPGTGGRGRWVRDFTGPIDARWFGASPAASALVNSRAFAAASDAINRRSGGSLLVPPGTYRVVQQPLSGRRGQRYAFGGTEVIHIVGCSRPVTLIGTGAILRVADGMRYGSFNPVTGRAHRPARMPFEDWDFRADGYNLIHVAKCTAPVRIEGFELDGNLGRYVLGGQWGDKGRQLFASGIFLDANTGGVSISKVHSHHHGLDGIFVMHKWLRPDSPRYPVTISDCVCDSNARQGMSWVGGTELTVIRSRFSRTGKGGFASAPSAGVDVEAEESICRNGRFIDCEFVDNAGVGFLADQGDVADIRLERCTMIGTTDWSAWPRKPGIVFDDCQFTGSIVNAFSDTNARRATKFYGCRFIGDTSLSATRTIKGPWLADLGGGAQNVHFKDCDFNAVSPDIGLPWSHADVIYEDCRFRQAGRRSSNPRGTFKGRNRIDSAGAVDLAGSRFINRVTLNGRLVP